MPPNPEANEVRIARLEERMDAICRKLDEIIDNEHAHIQWLQGQMKWLLYIIIALALGRGAAEVITAVATALRAQ